MPRYKLTISYDGSTFSGWQRQPDARTVEQELEDAFSKILQQPVDIVGQGRTDAGVHAAGQTAHVDLPEDRDIGDLIHGVNGITSGDVHIRGWEQVADDFHARFDAVSRTYHYYLLREPSPLHRNRAWYPGKVEISILHQLVPHFRGTHDFFGFSKTGPEDQSTICTVSDCIITENDETIALSITANRFLRHMVRRIAGTMIQVTSGRLDEKDVRKLIHDPAADIKAYTAPPQALTLHSVQY